MLMKFVKFILASIMSFDSTFDGITVRTYLCKHTKNGVIVFGKSIFISIQGLFGRVYGE